MYKVKRFSVRPYATKAIESSRKALLSGGDKFKIANDLSKVQKRYDTASRKVTSLNPLKMMKNSKDASDSYMEISREIGKILKN